MSSSISWTVFPTALGHAAIAWGEKGVVGVWLPEPDPAAVRRRVARRHPSAREVAPPPGIRDAISRITDLLAGSPADLTGVPLDLDRVPELHRRVYAVARSVPSGKTTTYGEIAARLGDAGAARAVGQALGANPWAIVVPCHRVLAAGGRTGGFSARGGTETKMQLLRIEGAVLL